MSAEQDTQRQPVRDIKEERLTYEDYAALPEEGPRYELVDGQLELLAPAPTPRHQLMVQAVYDSLHESCRSDFILLLAPVDVIFSRHCVLQPDLVLVRITRASIITNRGIEGPPDLVVEVVSPGSVERDHVHKMQLYASFGVPEYWLIEQDDAHLEQYVLTPGGGYVLHQTCRGAQTVRSRQAPCVAFTMEEIWRNLPALPSS